MKVFRTSVLFTFLFSACSCLPSYTTGEVPFVPTPPEVVNRMLDLADIKPGDVVYDVGSGDGRILIAAAKKYGVRAVGIEIDGDLIDKARSRARSEGVADLAEFREQDALTADISEATVDDLHAAGVQLQAPAETGGAKAWHARRL